MDKHAEAVFKAADYYEVTALKLLCEKALMKKVTGRMEEWEHSRHVLEQVTISNMLDMLVLADMYKAADLREATKALIVGNSRYSRVCLFDTHTSKTLFHHYHGCICHI